MKTLVNKGEWPRIRARIAPALAPTLAGAGVAAVLECSVTYSPHTRKSTLHKPNSGLDECQKKSKTYHKLQ